MIGLAIKVTRATQDDAIDGVDYEELDFSALAYLGVKPSRLDVDPYLLCQRDD